MIGTRWLRAAAPAAALSLLLSSAPQAQQRFDQELLNGLQFRNLGPFRAGGWISDIDVPERPAREHLYTMYVSARHGGLWKTENNGTTWKPLFDHQGEIAIGDIALAPSDPRIVWVGTGDASSARSSYAGRGVYRSTDGGESWQHMGLPESHHVARIVIHPTDPNVVYVAAMGHLYSRNPERGVFRTMDGGRTWEKVLFIDDHVGVIDLVMNRDDPQVLYAAAYEKERFPWHLEEGGPESGIYKSVDGGRNWQRLENGLPTGKIGRIGLDVYRRDPNIVYAVVENLNLRRPTPEEAKQDRERGREPQQRAMGGEVYRSEDAGRSWRKMNSVKDNVGGKAAYSFNQIRVDPQNDQNLYVTTIGVANSTDGGRTWHDIDWPPTRLFGNIFGDVRTLWIDPEDPDRIIVGSDGGIHVSYDGGKTADYYDNLPLGEFYAIDVDMEDPYNIYGGLQDHESWKGPSNSWRGAVMLEDWVTVGTGDGMYNRVDPTDSRWLYNASQFGDHFRVDQKLGTRTDIEPKPAPGKPAYRFNWNPPVVISPHDTRVIYTGAQVLLRSPDRGDTWQEISPVLTGNDPAKLNGRGNITYQTITTVSESSRAAGTIWVGTDDGRVQVTRDGGAAWTDATPALQRAGAPRERWVSRVLASPHDEGTAYVTFTGYRNDDFRPYIYRTTDHGATWTSVAGDLPERPINVVFQDRVNPRLLYVGNDLGVYVTLDGGERWVRFRSNLPDVAAYDLLVHPRENDLVVGTYGRGLFVTDVTALQEITEEILASDLHLFRVEPKAHRGRGAWGNYQLYGDRHLVTPNEPDGLVIRFYSREGSARKAKLTVADATGGTIRTLEGEVKAGINEVVWDMRDADRKLMSPGEYRIRLELDGRSLTQPARIREPYQGSVGEMTR